MRVRHVSHDVGKLSFFYWGNNLEWGMTINFRFIAPKIWGQASLDERGTLQQWQYIEFDNITTTARPGVTKIPTIIPWKEAYSD